MSHLYKRVWMRLARPTRFSKGHIEREAPAGTFVRVDADEPSKDGTVKVTLSWQGHSLSTRVPEDGLVSIFTEV